MEGLGFDLLMVSDHIAITPDVAERYPAPFYEPFTTLSWLAGITTRVRLGTTVLIAPYRHPLLTARMAANLDRLSGGRLVLGVGVGWARQEFAALGIPFEQRGRLTDDHLRAVRAAWSDTADYGTRRIPVWVGGNSDAGLRRAVRLGDAWHPLRCTMPWLREAAVKLKASAREQHLPVPALAPGSLSNPPRRRSADRNGSPGRARSTRSWMTSTNCGCWAPRASSSTTTRATPARPATRRPVGRPSPRWPRTSTPPAPDPPAPERSSHDHT